MMPKASVLPNDEMIKAIEFYQDLGMCHPMTCGNDSRHANLVGAEVDGKIILKCPDCEYTQAFIPWVIADIWQRKDEPGFFDPFTKARLAARKNKG